MFIKMFHQRTRKKMNVDKKASISIIDPEASTSLHRRLSETLENIRLQLRTRPATHTTTSPQSPRMSATLSRTRHLHKQLSVARIREANLQDEIDNMKSEIGDKNEEIAELRRVNCELRSQLEDDRHRSSGTLVELDGGLEVLNDKLRLRTELLNGSISEDGNNGGILRSPTPPASSRCVTRCTSPHQPQAATIILNPRAYRPTTSPLKLTSSYIPDISRHFRNARVVSDAEPLFRVYSRS
jgi:hypothetical protein